MLKIVVIGSVNSTKWVIEKLLFHKFQILGVLGYEPENVKNISGWVDLKESSMKWGLPFMGFRKINDKSCLDWVKEIKPDCIFAVGFSQLLKLDWFNIPRYGCIGFHPTKLPRGRGRAPLAWLVHEIEDGAATFFLMGTGTDDGPIFVQVPFSLSESDDAFTVERKIEVALNSALDLWLPQLKQGIWNPIPQIEYDASYYGKRGPEDGIINWRDSAFQIDRLIKASTQPHPGAYSYFNSKKIIIWSSQIEKNIKIKGVIGRILMYDTKRGYLIQTGEGLLWLQSIVCEDKIYVGSKFGFNVEDEIFNLKLLFSNLKKYE